MKTHKLKILYKHWFDIISGLKTHEIRFNDRTYQIGDLLEFTVLQNDGSFISPIVYEVIHILRSEEFPDGLKDGYCILSIKKWGEDGVKF